MLDIYVKARVGEALSNKGKHIDNLSTGVYRLVNGQSAYNHTIWCKESRSRSVILQTYYAIYVILKDLTAQDKNDDYITILSNRTQCVEVMTNSIRIWGEDNWPVSKFSYRDAYNYAKQHHLPHVYLNKVPSNYYSYKPLFSLLQALYSILITFHHIHFKMCNIEDSQFKRLSDYLNVPYVTKRTQNNVHRQYYLLSTKVPKDLKQSFIQNCNHKSVNYQDVIKLLITKYINGNLNEKSHELKIQLTKTLNKIHDLKESNHKQKTDNKKIITSLKKKLTASSDNRKKVVDLKKGVKHLEKIVDHDNNEIKKANKIFANNNKQVEKAKKIIKGNTSNKGNNKKNNQSQYIFKPDKNAGKELNQMIGLKDVKEAIAEYISESDINRRTKELGQKDKDVAMNLVFEGNPGTGKTQVARLLPRILYNHHAIQEPIFVKAKVSDIIQAAHIFGASTKMSQYIHQAIGGVLFLDEAYQLLPPQDMTNDPREDIITTLLQGAENYHGKLVIILAGYTKPMNKLLSDTNPGMKSRFSRIIKFPDYTSDEMFGIFKLKAKGYHLSFPTINLRFAHKELDKFLNYLHDNHISSDNGRTVRNIIEYIYEAKNGIRLRHKNIAHMNLSEINTVHNSDIYRGFARAKNEIKRQNK